MELLDWAVLPDHAFHFGDNAEPAVSETASRCESHAVIAVEDGVIRHYESIPLDMNALYTFDKGISNGTVFIDEIQLWSSNHTTMSVVSRLLASILTLIRKRGLSFYYTVQSFEWLTRGMKFQIDAWITCMDLHFKFHNLEQGTSIMQVYHDMSGMFTGDPYNSRDENAQTYRLVFHAKPFWQIYDSFNEFNPLLASQKLEIHQERVILDVDAMGSAVVAPPGDGDFLQESNEASISAVIQSLQFGGQRHIAATDLEAVLKASGCQVSLRQLTQVLPKYGLIKVDNGYDLIGGE